MSLSGLNLGVMSDLSIVAIYHVHHLLVTTSYHWSVDLCAVSVLSIVVLYFSIAQPHYFTFSELS